MPLILAVEPDRRQASHLAAVLRRRPRTELVIDGSATRALDTLAARVPDVLLTSPLLSPQDETALADWLRSLGPAAARVQALTIPILATAKPAAPPPRGVLSVLRRQRAQPSTPDGCEPDMFADQVDVYLERTSVQRDVDANPDSAPIAAIATIPEPTLPEPAAPEAAIPEQIFIEPPTAETPTPARVLETAPCVIPTTPEPTPPLVAGAILGLAARVRGALSELRRHFPTVSTPHAGETTVVPDQTPIGRAPTELAVTAPVRSLATPTGHRADDVRVAPVATVADDDATWISLSLEELKDAPALLAWAHDEPPSPEDVWILGPIQEAEDLFVPPAPAPVRLRKPVVNILAAPPVEVVASPPPLPKVAAAETSAPRQPAPRKKAAKAKKAKPAQDEWGFFDPDQCGFAALLDKLDEITDNEMTAEKREDTTVRVVAY